MKENMNPVFVDTHVHFHFPEYDLDRDATIQRSHDAGVRYLVNVGTDVPSSKQSIELAEKYDFIFAAAGIHPHDAKEANPEVMKQIKELILNPSVVAIGEVGLDFFHHHSSKEEQIPVLKEFLKLYDETKKPLIIHCRDAYEDFLKILIEHGSAPYRGVMHCFSSDRPMMEKLLEVGFYISFAGPLTYKKNDDLREACRACPLDRILFETDAPFLSPQAYRGKRNESSYLLETAKMAAEVKGISLEELAQHSTENAKRLFGLC